MSINPRMKLFEELTHTEQVAAVLRMYHEGASELLIAHATGWSIEYVQRVLGERLSA